MKLYYLPGACSLGAHIALRWAEADFALERLSRQDLKSPDYLAKNPLGAVPLLEDGDLLVTQNLAVLLHIADRHPDLVLAGFEPRERTELHQWLAFLAADLHPAFGPLFAPARLLADRRQHEPLRVRARERIDRMMRLVDQRLEDRTWLVGLRRSVADCYLFSITRWLEVTVNSISSYPHLAQHHRRMMDDVAVQESLTEEGLVGVERRLRMTS